MPLFEYRCSSCGREFERLASAEAEVPSCPSCGSKDVKKTVSGFAAGGSGCGAPREPYRPAPRRSFG